MSRGDVRRGPPPAARRLLDLVGGFHVIAPAAVLVERRLAVPLVRIVYRVVDELILVERVVLHGFSNSPPPFPRGL